MEDIKSYSETNAGQRYLEFANSEDGKFQQQTLSAAILSYLPKSPVKILDAGCGSGWLIKELAKQNHTLHGCDVSKILLDAAKKDNPNSSFEICDLNIQQPFTNQEFDYVITNMVIHDLEDQLAGFKHLANSLKPNGQMIVTIPNPYYTYPLGDWRRQRLGRLLGEKPRLQLKEYRKVLESGSKFIWGDCVPAYWYPLPLQINNAVAAGFELIKMQDILAPKDSKRFNLNYRLYRFPLFILLVFKKMNN